METFQNLEKSDYHTFFVAFVSLHWPIPCTWSWKMSYYVPPTRWMNHSKNLLPLVQCNEFYPPKIRDFTSDMNPEYEYDKNVPLRSLYYHPLSHLFCCNLNDLCIWFKWIELDRIKKIVCYRNINKVVVPCILLLKKWHSSMVKV